MKNVNFENVQELLDRGNKPEEVFDYVGEIYEGFACVQLKGKWNYIDLYGKIAFPNQWFDDGYKFKEGFACVKLNKKYNFIDKNGILYDVNKKPLNVNISKKNYSLIKGEENSVFVWSSFFSDANFEEIPSNDNYLVVITNNKKPLITIYNCEGFTEEEKEELVKRHCQFLTSGCNYTYELKRKVGNCYFCS